MHALIPMKPLAEAKSRLCGVLSPAERQALMVAMASDVLAVLVEYPHIASITLLGDDPEVAALAGRSGVRHWSEQALGANGLNAVVTAGCERLIAEQATTILVLHADIPLLSCRDVDSVAEVLAGGADLVIGCDSRRTGTNLLAFHAAAIPAFAFGGQSYVAHRDWAGQQGLRVETVQREGIGLDIDEPADIERLKTQLPDRHDGATARFFATGAAIVPVSLPSDDEALALAEEDDTAALVARARRLRDAGHGDVVTYSRKVFVPLTQLCRDVCHYCTFAQTPRHLEQAYMPVEDVLALCREGAKLGCQEALFTLGEKPELRYRAAREALAEMGYSTTLEYVQEVARRVHEETGLLPHINAGCMTAEEIAGLREVSASMGIMLESASERLCQKGMPHYGSPDKDPARRLETLELAGQANVPFTSGILIGIGETRRERIEALLALRATHQRHGHLQEVIVQNFRAKPGTLMSEAPEPDLEDLLWTIAVARIIFGPEMNIQAPPNLSPGVLEKLVAAGINDWGGVSPLTPDHVNPEAPWPHLDRLAAATASAGKFLDQRLTVYPSYARDAERWLAPGMRAAVVAQGDASGFARRDDWVPGQEQPVPPVEAKLLKAGSVSASDALRDIVRRCWQRESLTEQDVTTLLEARGPAFSFVVSEADRMREHVNGDTVSYVVNRNINYTNVCYFKCQFCAFSKGKRSENLRGRPYDISALDLAERVREAWERGATEVCMQGGIHPDYTGQTYLDIVDTVRHVAPQMHIHAFSPLEVFQGAETLGISVRSFVQRLVEAGLNTLPGTAAEILHDDVRAELCPDKISAQQWLDVMEVAHEEGLRTTATIMYGHLERPAHCAAHLLRIRALQQRTGGFTEFVPLPFVHMEAPMYLKGRARRGPTFREAVLIHAVTRLVFHGLIDNIQTSWVKMGQAGIQATLRAGANDLGGSLMNESITRAAGTLHGQEWSPQKMEQEILAAGRVARMRTTLYGVAPLERRAAAFKAQPLVAVEGADAQKLQRSKRLTEVQRLVLQPVAPVESALYEQVVLHAACN